MIYFVRRPDTGRIKIGTTIRLSRRLEELREEAKCELVLLAIMDGHRDQERALHDRFSHAALGGEWFDPCDDLIGFIDENGREWDGTDDRPKRSEARLILSQEEMDRARKAAKRYRIPLTSFIRQAVLKMTVDTERIMGR